MSSPPPTHKSSEHMRSELPEEESESDKDRLESDKERSKSAKEQIPIKSPKDKLDYKFITLDNGLEAMLVSDPTYKDLKDSDKSPSPKRIQEQSESSDYTTDDSDSDSRKCGKCLRRTTKHRHKKSNTDSEKLSAVVLCVRSGSFCDPKEVQGLAHLVEHVITMGSKKFPEENALHEYLSSRGGFQNAQTDYEYTIFEIEVQRKHLYGALERLANCFVEPLLEPDSISREAKAVNTEFMEAMNDDNVRIEQIYNNAANADHPLHCFPWGNKKSLEEIPGRTRTQTLISVC